MDDEQQEVDGTNDEDEDAGFRKKAKGAKRGRKEALGSKGKAKSQAAPAPADDDDAAPSTTAAAGSTRALDAGNIPLMAAITKAIATLWAGIAPVLKEDGEDEEVRASNITPP